MKHFTFIIAFCLFSLCCSGQKTYLAGIKNVPINVTCEEFRQNISRECQYLGEYVVASFEESPRLYDEMAEAYVTNDVWGHGRTHVYVICKEGRVKQVFMEFPWGDASTLGSDSFATYTWGAGNVFPDLFGTSSNKDKGWDDSVSCARYKLSETWIRPDGIRVTITCYLEWNQDPFNKERSPIDLKGRQARTEILYEVL